MGLGLGLRYQAASKIIAIRDFRFPSRPFTIALLSANFMLLHKAARLSTICDSLQVSRDMASTNATVPSASSHRAITNQISLLLASRAAPSLLSSSATSNPTTRPPYQDNDAAAWSHVGDSNSGVGHVAGKAKDDSDAASRALRGRLLGGTKRKQQQERDGGGRGRARLGEESEGDEEDGRSGLGRKKKRVRRVDDAETREEGDGGVPDETAPAKGDSDDAAVIETPAPLASGESSKRKKKKNKKNKKKQSSASES